MLYRGFLPDERRNRLLRKWNGLRSSDFYKDGISRHTALQDMCQIASFIQLQLRKSYQDEQHLHDALLNACKNEKWAHKLATVPTIRLLDLQESLARAITAEEDQMTIEKQASILTPAYPKDIHFTQDRPGMN